MKVFIVMEFGTDGPTSIELFGEGDILPANEQFDWLCFTNSAGPELSPEYCAAECAGTLRFASTDSGYSVQLIEREMVI